jgi:hypothetical protein
MTSSISSDPTMDCHSKSTCTLINHVIHKLTDDDIQKYMLRGKDMFNEIITKNDILQMKAVLSKLHEIYKLYSDKPKTIHLKNPENYITCLFGYNITRMNSPRGELQLKPLTKCDCRWFSLFNEINESIRHPKPPSVNRKRSLENTKENTKEIDITTVSPRNSNKKRKNSITEEKKEDPPLQPKEFPIPKTPTRYDEEAEPSRSQTPPPSSPLQEPLTIQIIPPSPIQQPREIIEQPQASQAPTEPSVSSELPSLSDIDYPSSRPTSPHPLHLSRPVNHLHLYNNDDHDDEQYLLQQPRILPQEEQDPSQHPKDNLMCSLITGADPNIPDELQRRIRALFDTYNMDMIKIIWEIMDQHQKQWSTLKTSYTTQLDWLRKIIQDYSSFNPSRDYATKIILLFHGYGLIRRDSNGML